MDKREPDNRVDREDENPQEIEENVNTNVKPFLSRMYSKTTPIGFQYHQVNMPLCAGPLPSRQQRLQQLQNRNISRRPYPSFLASRVNPEELEQYLNFAQSYFQEKIADYFTVGTISRERTRAKAMDFLHKMDYNYTKAKFYILFPYYLTYNSYRCHDPLSISLQDMSKKINDHLESLKNTKQKDMQKWIQTLESCLTNRTKFQNFLILIEQGKQNKYQIPEHIKQQIEKSQKIGKELRKSLQGTKLNIQALRSKRQMLDEYKLQTHDMIAFEDSVSRCQEWIKKQEAFEESYYDLDESGSYVMKDPQQKIQFRQIQVLVSEYNNLPLLCTQFENKTKILYNKTIELLENIPNINKIVKTRNAKQVTLTKIPYRQMRDYLKLIDGHPVWHEDFLTFQINMRESMELIERTSMFLQDQLSQKNSKSLNNYIKLIADVQIENNVQKRLRNRQECNELMQKIKRQITNPGKVDYIKQNYAKLRQKGNKQIQDLVYQKKIQMYIGWFESQQKLKEPKSINSNVQVIEKQVSLSDRLVNANDFRNQLEAAKKQWNISEELIQESYHRLDKNIQHVAQIKNLLADPSPQIHTMLQKLKQSISNGLKFPQLEQLHEQIALYFAEIVKVHWLLRIRPQNLDLQIQKKFLFKPSELDYIISILYFPEEIRTLKTKEKAEELLELIKKPQFPHYLPQCQAFEDFMKNGEEWAERARELIKKFTENGDSIDIRQLEDSRYYLHSKAIKDEIGKIEAIIRWRQKISKKLQDGRPQLFSEEEEQFLQKLEKDLHNFESLAQGNISFKEIYLEYSTENEKKIRRILNLIANESKIENICKLSQMNKFHRQIEKQNERHRIQDKKILQLKENFRDEILAADDWKQKYLVIKRFEKKKITKKEDIETPAMNDDPVDENYIKDNIGIDGPYQMSPEINQSLQYRKKFAIKNGQFSWYFKFLVMISQFSKGYKLKFCLEQLSKLKNSLGEVEKFITHYDKVFDKPEPYDTQLSNLDSEASKIQIFIRQIWILKKKFAYVNSWRIIADSILDSVPIVSMELKARKPQDLLTVLANRKMETEEAKKQLPQERVHDLIVTKRQRKPNSYYFSSDIAVFTQDNLGTKPKKKKKGAANGDGQYRNTAVLSQSKKNTKSELLEEIERTEAIIKAGVEAGTLAEDPKQYCICRYGEPNQNTTMVQCEGRCEQWFHIECIGIKKHQAKSDNRYTCVGCSSLYDMKSSGAFYWDYHSRISEYALDQILTEGKNLGVFTQQLKKINVVYQKMRGWKQKAKQIIYNVLRDDFVGKDINHYKDELYQVYLLSLWLPTYHYQASTVRRLLLFCRDDKIDSISI